MRKGEIIHTINDCLKRAYRGESVVLIVPGSAEKSQACSVATVWTKNKPSLWPKRFKIRTADEISYLPAPPHDPEADITVTIRFRGWI